MSITGLFDLLRQDTVYAFRMVRKKPAFALTVMGILALGIGANTTIFTVVHAVLLKPLAYREPDRLVRISSGATVAKFDVIQKAQSFAGVSVSTVFTETITLSTAETSEGLRSARVSPNFLSLLGVVPVTGRSFLPEESRVGMSVAMISAELWSSHFGSDSKIAGKTVRLGGAPCTIVGVLPRNFQFPASNVDVWLPWQPEAMPLQIRLNSPILAVFGRLADGVSIQQANAEMISINRQYALAYPSKLDAKTERFETVTPFQDQLVHDIRPTLWMLTGAVGLMLAIACANIASLLLVRAQSRSREFAVRSAIGASKARIIFPLLIESVLLALGGGAFGVMAAIWLLHGIEKIPGLNLPRAAEVQFDGTVLGFAIALSVGAGILFGFAPALYGLRVRLIEVLKGSGENSIVIRSRRFLPVSLDSRGLLVVFQIALSVMLLIGAALLIESVARLRRVDPGFNPENLLTMQLTLPPAQGVPPNLDTLIERVESIPGVRSASITLTLPTTGFAATPVYAANQDPPPLNQRPIAVLQVVTPHYFPTMGIALRRGRDFAWRDRAAAPMVVIVNESMARRFWPGYPKGQDPVGQSILAGAGPVPLQIVGIVADVRQAGLADAATPGIYRPRMQVPPMPAMFAVRTNVNPMQVVNAIRAEMMTVNRDMSVVSVKSMTDVIDHSEGQRRGVMFLLSLFAAVGLMLSCIGTYGSIAYSVTSRTQELGIRKALGAGSSDISWLVLGQGLGLTSIGLVLGFGGALLFTRVLQNFLFEVRSTEPRIFVCVAVFSLGVTFLASYFPLLRALQIEPTAALRS